MSNPDVEAFIERVFSDEDEVKHFGIKGMRWGFRKNGRGGHTKTGRAKGEKTKEVSSEAAEARAARNKIRKSGLDSLTNKEVQALVTRQNLEQQYARLNPSRVQKGAKIAKNILGAAKTVNDVANVVNTLNKNASKLPDFNIPTGSRRRSRSGSTGQNYQVARPAIGR